MVTSDKAENVENAIKLVRTAKSNSAEIVVLPEIFNSPYGTSKLSNSKLNNENNYFELLNNYPSSFLIIYNNYLSIQSTFYI